MPFLINVFLQLRVLLTVEFHFDWRGIILHFFYFYALLMYHILLMLYVFCIASAISIILWTTSMLILNYAWQLLHGRFTEGYWYAESIGWLNEFKTEIELLTRIHKHLVYSIKIYNYFFCVVVVLFTENEKLYVGNNSFKC